MSFKDFWSQPYILRYSFPKQYYRTLINEALYVVKNIVDGFSPKFIADLGAGTGEASLILSRLFPDSKIFAIDFSKDFVASIRAKSKRTHNVMPILHDYRRRLPVQDIDFEIGLYNPVGYYGLATDRKILRNFLLSLSIDGVLFLDLINPSFVLTNWKLYGIKEAEFEKEKVIITHYRSLEYGPSVWYEVNHLKYSFLSKKTEKDFSYRLWLYTPYHISKMIEVYGRILKIVGIRSNGKFVTYKNKNNFSIDPTIPRVGFFISRKRR